MDTSATQPGLYNISFDVRDFQHYDLDTALYFHVYEGSGSHEGRINVQVTFQAVLPELAPTAPELRESGAAIRQVSIDNEIRGGGRFSLDFDLTETGGEGDFLALAWSQFKGRGSSRMPSMSVDNISVSRLGEATPAKR